MEIKFKQTWCDYLTECPHGKGEQVGSYECVERCGFCVTCDHKNSTLICKFDKMETKQNLTKALIREAQEFYVMVKRELTEEEYTERFYTALVCDGDLRPRVDMDFVEKVNSYKELFSLDFSAEEFSQHAKEVARVFIQKLQETV